MQNIQNASAALEESQKTLAAIAQQEATLEEYFSLMDSMLADELQTIEELHNEFLAAVLDRQELERTKAPKAEIDTAQTKVLDLRNRLVMRGAAEWDNRTYQEYVDGWA